MTPDLAELTAYLGRFDTASWECMLPDGSTLEYPVERRADGSWPDPPRHLEVFDAYAEPDWDRLSASELAAAVCRPAGRVLAFELEHVQNLVMRAWYRVPRGTPCAPSRG